MLKPILASTVLAVVCSSAHADDQVMYRIDFSLSADSPTHKDTLFVSDNTCSEMSTKTSAHASVFKVCARPLDGKKVRLEIERRVRDGADEKQASAVVIATPLASIRMLDATLTLKAP